MSIDVAIIQFPGSNTERGTFMACNRAGLNPVEFLWNESRDAPVSYTHLTLPTKA